MKKVIVISGINLRSGGPLTILRDCLSFLSQNEISKQYHIVALVHKKELCDFPNIEYIEFPDSINSWIKRLYYEYIHFRRLSKKLKPYLWLSLHDITPNVNAERQAVYMHNPSIVNRIKLRDFKYDKTYIAFALLYKYLYKINIKRNNYCIVQQEWFKTECSKKFSIPGHRFIVASPNITLDFPKTAPTYTKCKTFFFPSFPRPFKNFETVCKAASLLVNRGWKDFKIILTLDPNLNSYAKDIIKKYHNISQIEFVGLIPPREMQKYYGKTDCLIFPSRLETWGLPISEFIPFNKPMIVADEPYAHETSQGANMVSFFSTNNAEELSLFMEQALEGKFERFSHNDRKELAYPFAKDYDSLFKILLSDDPMMIERISNRYSLSDKFRLFGDLVLTKIKYPKQRIVRQSFICKGGGNGRSRDLVDHGA